MYIDKNTIEQIKQIPIADLLSKWGYSPVKAQGQELVYRSPLREEKSASFYVNTFSNRFNDFGGSQDAKGDIIRLTQLKNNCSFNQAIECLVGYDLKSSVTPFSFSGKNDQATRKMQIVEVKDLTSSHLITYSTKRGISLEVATRYLKEVVYKVNAWQFRAIGFSNRSQGYELRNEKFKGKTSNDITIIDCQTKEVAIYEGFFDFLSSLCYASTLEPPITSIVLNSIANIGLLVDCLESSSTTDNSKVTLYAYLDNDQAGKNTLYTLQNKGFNVVDMASKVYPNNKDFNDYWLDYQYENCKIVVNNL